MLTRHSLTAIVMFCAFVPALAQDSNVLVASWPSAIRGTAAYPLRQDATQWLGSNLIGAKVMSITNESIGRISNLIVNENGAVEAAVISVGGFFDIRHKDVAVTFKSLIIMRNRTADAIDHVTLAASKKDLLQAAAFQPLSQQRAALER